MQWYFRTQLYFSLVGWPRGKPTLPPTNEVLADIVDQHDKLNWAQLFDEVLTDRMRYQAVMRDPAARHTACTHLRFKFVGSCFLDPGKHSSHPRKRLKVGTINEPKKANEYALARLIV